MDFFWVLYEYEFAALIYAILYINQGGFTNIDKVKPYTKTTVNELLKHSLLETCPKTSKFEFDHLIILLCDCICRSHAQDADPVFAAAE